MSMVGALKLASGISRRVDKDFFTVGTGKGFDLTLPGVADEMVFSIRCRNDEWTLIPAARKIRVNGDKCGTDRMLQACDRIEWQDQVIVFLTEMNQAPLHSLSSTKLSSAESSPLQVFKDLAENLGSGSPLAQSLQITLLSLLEQAQAEGGTLVGESGDGADWRILATSGTSDKQSCKELVSHTLLTEAISTRKPVYIESLIGHEWAVQRSLFNAKVFSVACVPLVGGDRVFGALFLYTWRAGQSIRREALEAIQVITTQAALLFLSHRELQATRAENQRLKTGASAAGESIIFDRSNPGSPMAGVIERIVKLAPHDLSILIRGETGTGKELVSREVHRHSQRAKGPFVALNCAAIPPTLMESILFGATRGAFTGAVKDRPGKFVQANGGTLFLDEIGDLSLELQTKLLRVLQEKEVEAVGGNEPTPIDVRILSATHQNLENLVKEGKFRKDLFYRLNGASIPVPTLQARGAADIEALAKVFLQRLDPRAQFTGDALSKLKHHSWPGNVRELEQVVSRAFAFCKNSQITAQEIELDEGLNEAVSAVASFDLSSETIEPLKQSQDKFTQQFVKKVLDRCQGNRAKAASLLGISERTLYRLLAQSDSFDSLSRS